MSELSASDFEGKEGTFFDVAVDGEIRLRMKLLEVKLGQPLQLPKWKPIGNMRPQPFSLFFESDRKLALYANTYLSAEGFETSLLKIEPIQETDTGMIYQASFN